MLSLSRPSSLETILFDLDGTLRHSCPSSAQVFYDYAVQLGTADGLEKRQQAARWAHYYWAQSPELLQDFQDFPDTESFERNYTLRALLAFACGQPLAQELAPEIYRYMHEEHHAQNCVPGDVPPTLEILRQAGLRLAVVSNRSKPCLEELSEIGLLEYFDLVLVAGEVSAWKPDPAIFTHALERLGSPASQTIYVGDNYYSDVVGAQRSGIQAVLLDPDDLFPEAGCPMIRSIGDLPALLGLGANGCSATPMLTTPDGSSFLLSNSLGREEVPTLAENLVPVK